MKRFAVGSLCVLAVVASPRLASASLSLQIGPEGNPALVDEVVLPNSGQHFFDLIFNETPPAENEGLFAYDLNLKVNRQAGSTGGMRLTGADRPPSGFVLSDDPSKSTFSVATNTPDELLINISSNNDLFDVTSGQKAARIFYTIDPGSAADSYTVAFDTNNTVFGSGDPNRPDPAIPVALTDVGRAVFVPEPGSLAVLGLAGLLALKRRR